MRDINSMSRGNALAPNRHSVRTSRQIRLKLDRFSTDCGFLEYKRIADFQIQIADFSNNIKGFFMYKILFFVFSQ